jgi:predicted RecA/RadA family phage recombinase
MKNYVKPGKSIDYVNAGAAIASGAVVLIGGILPGVAAGDIAAITGKGPVEIEGVFKLAKEAPLVIAQGDRVYWDNSAKKVTKTAGANVFMGVAALAAFSADTEVQVRLIPLGDSEAGNLAQAAVVAALTDGTMTGTANGAMELVGDTSMADQAAVIMNNFKECQTQINAILTALKNAGLMATS